MQIELFVYCCIAEYEKKLKAAGVHCELHLAKGAVHGFCTMPGWTVLSDKMWCLYNTFHYATM